MRNVPLPKTLNQRLKEINKNHGDDMVKIVDEELKGENFNRPKTAKVDIAKSDASDDKAVSKALLEVLKVLEPLSKDVQRRILKSAAIFFSVSLPREF